MLLINPFFLQQIIDVTRFFCYHTSTQIIDQEGVIMSLTSKMKRDRKAKIRKAKDKHNRKFVEGASSARYSEQYR